MEIQSHRPAVGHNVMRHHLGIDFEVWKAQESWYWLVARPGLDGGAIGAAATEASAMRDAYWSIEEMAASRGERTASHDEPSILRRSAAIKAKCWEATLANLQRYLTWLECSAI
jgi:hypothetical protein